MLTWRFSKAVLLVVIVTLVAGLGLIACTTRTVSTPIPSVSTTPIVSPSQTISTPIPTPPSSTPAPSLASIPPTTTSGSIPQGLAKIQHFVFIMQENRSFDSYFGTYPGADGIPKGISFVDPHDGSTVAPYHDTSVVNLGGPHDWDNAQADINGGKMDGFLSEAYKGINANGTPFVPNNVAGHNPKDVMGWHDYHEIPNYWNYAKLYVLQERMFESVASYSLPAHLYMLAAQSGGYYSYGKQPYPSTYNFPEITELLTSGKIDWKYYVTAGTLPDTEDGHVVGAQSDEEQDPDKYTLWNPLPAFPAVQNDPAQRSRLQGTSQFYIDAANGNLPQVSWVIPSGAVSEHPPAG